MALLLTAGAVLQCSFGAAPSALNVPPLHSVRCGTAAATVQDHLPIVNIAPFGMCSCNANPMVIAMTAAALGVPTPAPCIPVTVAPWMPGSPTVMIGKLPALQNSSKAQCNWGGVISVTTATQFTTSLP